MENASHAYRKFQSLCEERGITPYRVAASTNGKVSTATLSQWKHGAYNLKLDKLREIAKVFDVPVTEFIEEQEGEK